MNERTNDGKIGIFKEYFDEYMYICWIFHFDFDPRLEKGEEYTSTLAFMQKVTEKARGRLECDVIDRVQNVDP